MAFAWITRLLRAGGRPRPSSGAAVVGGDDDERLSARRVLEAAVRALRGGKLPLGEILVGDSVEVLASFPE